MKLIVAHQVLIGAAIGLSGIFAVRSLTLYLRAGAALDLGLCLASVAVGAGLALYLRKVRARWREQKGRA